MREIICHKGMIQMFSKEEIELMQSIGITARSFEALSDDEAVQIEDKVADCLMERGFDESYEPTKLGLLCEGILDKLYIT